MKRKPPEQLGFMAASGWRVLHDFYQLDMLARCVY
jgi:hypothetical protein